jgi:hypothetical protein
MSASITEALQRAFELLESNQDAEARAVLEPLLREHPDNADAWWIYSHATEDPLEARRALRNVLRIDPEYPEAAETMRMLDLEHPEVVPDAPDLPEIPAASADIDEEPEFLSEAPVARPVPSAAAYPPPTPRRQPSRFPWWIAAVLALVVIIVLVLLLTRPPEQTVEVANATDAAQGMATEQVTMDLDATATAIILIATADVQAVSTDAPLVEPTLETSTADAVPTEPLLETATGDAQNAAPTSDPAVATDAAPPATDTSATLAVNPLPTIDVPVASGSPLEVVQAALSGAGLADFTLASAQTSLGSAYQVTVCSAEGVELRNVVLTSMVALANSISAVPADVTAVSTRVVSCTDSSRVIRNIVASRADAEAFIRGELTQEQYAAFWLSQ